MLGTGDAWLGVVAALERVQVLRDPAGRGLCLDLLTHYLGFPLQVRHFPATRQHLFSILLACEQVPDAFPALIKVLDELEPGSQAVLSAQRMITAGIPHQRTDIPQLHPGGSEMDQPVPVPLRTAEQPAVWGAVPPRNDNFTGRSRLLDAVHEHLATVALLGMGGVGKSQIATEFAYRNAVNYELVWWIPAEEQTQAQAALVELAQRLRLPVEPSADAAVPAVLAALGTGEPYRNWLLVFDNADRPEDVRPFFPKGPGHVLITSRNAQWATVTEAVEVDVFSRTESVQLLQRRNRDLTDTDANRLAEALGDLPLAVEQAAAWHAETGMPVDDYLDLYEDRREQLRSNDDVQLAVAATWALSMDRLSTENQGAFVLLRVCAFLAPEPIPRTMFVNVPELPGFARLEETLRDPVQLSRAIRDINRYSLARVDQRTDTIQLHRLVQLALRVQLDETSQRELRHAAHLILASADPGQPDNVEAWSRYSELMPHAIACQAADCMNPRARRLAINVVVFLFAWGDPEAAREMAADLVTRWQDTLGENHRDTLIAARWIGRALRQLGRFDEARRVGERTLTLMRDHLGDDHEDTLLTAHAVASDWRAKGDFRAARDLNEDAYRKARARFGDDDTHTLAAANNYALSLRLNGDPEAARILDEDTWRRKVVVQGENHRHTLLTLDNLSVDLLECGRWLQARQMQELTVRRFREHVGVRHPMTLAATKNLAVARRRSGDPATALPLAQLAFDGFVSRYGPGQPDAMSALMCLSVNLRQLGRREEARQLGLRVHSLYQQAWGDRHPFTSAAATNLAVTLGVLGELGEARYLNDKALRRMRAVLGNDHPFTLACAVNLATDLARSGQYGAARDLNLATLDRARSALAVDHPTTLAAAINLAMDLRSLGQHDESADLQNDTVERLSQVLGPDHPATISAANNHRAVADIDAPQI
ncbi:FxSxx-COOH system tetratricopeptide repeat protein [Actinocrispum sp. NPDC049592]|uniref:FxSxx-COOH system tetratricopeptide repeat protein n=1 Tax=Actinocrispum sp. NPDC049592 TaxID=3154835 RepID=UPI00342B1951